MASGSVKGIHQQGPVPTPFCERNTVDNQAIEQYEGRLDECV